MGGGRRNKEGRRERERKREKREEGRQRIVAPGKAHAFLKAAAAIQLQPSFTLSSISAFTNMFSFQGPLRNFNICMYSFNF